MISWCISYHSKPAFVRATLTTRYVYRGGQVRSVPQIPFQLPQKNEEKRAFISCKAESDVVEREKNKYIRARRHERHSTQPETTEDHHVLPHKQVRVIGWLLETLAWAASLSTAQHCSTKHMSGVIVPSPPACTFRKNNHPVNNITRRWHSLFTDRFGAQLRI